MNGKITHKILTENSKRHEKWSDCRCYNIYFTYIYGVLFWPSFKNANFYKKSLNLVYVLWPASNNQRFYGNIRPGPTTFVTLKKHIYIGNQAVFPLSGEKTTMISNEDFQSVRFKRLKHHYNNQEMVGTKNGKVLTGQIIVVNHYRARFMKMDKYRIMSINIFCSYC